MLVSCSATPRSIAYWRDARVLVAEDLEAHQPDRRRDADAVFVELGERLVAARVEIHLDAVDQRLERRPRQIELADQRLQRASLRRLRRACRRSTRAARSATVPLAAAPARRLPPRRPHRPPRGRNPRRRRSRAACPAAARGTSSRSSCRGAHVSAAAGRRARSRSGASEARATPAAGVAGAKRRPMLEDVEVARLRADRESACRRARWRAAPSAAGRSRRRRPAARVEQRRGSGRDRLPSAALPLGRHPAAIEVRVSRAPRRLRVLARHVKPAAAASRSRGPARSSSAAAPCTRRPTARRALGSS